MKGTLILSTEHWQTTPFCGAAHKVVAMAVCVQKRTPLRSLKITATSPIQLTSKNVSSEKHLKDRAAVSDVTPQQTIFAAQRDVNRETPVHLPSYSANQQAVNSSTRKKTKDGRANIADWL